MPDTDADFLADVRMHLTYPSVGDNAMNEWAWKAVGRMLKMVEAARDAVEARSITAAACIASVESDLTVAWEEIERLTAYNRRLEDHIREARQRSNLEDFVIDPEDELCAIRASSA